MRSDTGRQSKAVMLELRMQTDGPNPTFSKALGMSANRSPRPTQIAPLNPQSRTSYPKLAIEGGKNLATSTCSALCLLLSVSLKHQLMQREKRPDLICKGKASNHREILVTPVPASGCIERLSLQSPSSPNLPRCPFTVVECSHVILVVPSFCLQDAQSFFDLGLKMTEPYLLQAACIYNILQYNRTLMAWSLAGSQVLQGQNAKSI